MTPSKFRRLVSASTIVAGILGPISLVLAQTLNDAKLYVREVVSGLNQPTAIAFIGLGDILVLQKADGRVRRAINGVLQAGQVLDVPVDELSERGLLGIALHPNFPATPFLYLYYTQSSASSDTSGSPLANRVYRYTWNGNSLVTPSLILDLPVTPGPNHNGGTMTFGPDGKLYVVIGDLNHNGQLQNNPAAAAPDHTSVIFRINENGSAPSDNPFFSQGGNLAKYYAYGVRNSFGLAFDPVTEELWDSENGPSSYDEINLVQPGFNSGWNQIMGPDARNSQNADDLVQFPNSHYADPKFSWFDTVGPTAIAFMSSPRLGADYENDLFVGDINNGNLYRFRVNGSRNGFDFTTSSLSSDLVADDNTELQEVILGTGFGGITDLKVGPDGLLYVLSFGLGKIFVISGSASAADFDGDSKADIGIYRDGIWSIKRSSDGGTTSVGWGGPAWTPVVADYDGDGIADIAVRNASNGLWSIVRSTDGGNTLIGWSAAAEDIPVPADYDGDGKADLTVYNTASAGWSIIRSTDGGLTYMPWGGPAWTPVVADYDGDGIADIAVRNASNGLWSIVRSTDGGNTLFGWSAAVNDIPVPADYDGDGKADFAVYNTATAGWSIIRSSDGGLTYRAWGGPAWEPVPADYDGDGKVDIAVYNSSIGLWSILRSSDGGNTLVSLGGAPQDIPLK